MKEIEIKSVFKLYNSYNDLNDDDQRLIRLAKEASSNAYAPYSKFQVGTSLILSDGSVIQGSNQENASYPVGICAERVALSILGTSGRKESVKTMVVYCDNNPKHSPAAPCGMCRQALLEQESKQKDNIRILLCGNSNEVIEIDSVKDILPLGFTSQDLC